MAVAMDTAAVMDIQVSALTKAVIFDLNEIVNRIQFALLESSNGQFSLRISQLNVYHLFTN